MRGSLRSKWALTAGLFFFMIVLTMSLNSCGGGGGSASPAPNTPSFFIKTVKASTGSTTGLGAIPIYGYGARSQLLYLAKDVKGSGTIQSLAFRFFSDHTAGYTCTNMTINMGEMLVSDLSGTFADNVTSGPTVTVFNNIVTIPTGSAGDTFLMNLDVPFTYNGTDNLLLDVTSSNCTGATPDFLAWSTSYSSEILGSGPKASSLLAWLNEILFKFSDGENTVLFTDDSTLSSLMGLPFSTLPQSHKVQLLYTAGEIGGFGPIKGIGFPIGTSPRHGSTLSEAGYTVNVKMGHTLLSSLTTTFADNYNAGQPADLASSATFTIPAGLQDGAYVWLPVSSGAFTYNGTANVLVEIEVTAASATTFWLAGSNPGTGNMRLDGAEGAADGSATTAHYNIRFRF